IKSQHCVHYMVCKKLPKVQLLNVLVLLKKVLLVQVQVRI
uniref:Ovule protein n=1 Tax=Meloidogyne hapla TaxID=6305 RepID=A0A1I8BC02_MELHA